MPTCHERGRAAVGPLVLGLRLKRRDVVAIVAAGGAVVLASGVGWSDGAGWIGIGLGVAVAIVVGAQIEVLRRLLPLFEAARASDRQLEALANLLSAVRPRAPLPRMRGWAISPDFGNVILQTIAETKPRRILECGSGASTVLCGYALERLGEGEAIALDHDPYYAARTRRALLAHDLGRARVVDAQLVDTALPAGAWRWYDLSGIEEVRDVDMLIVDGPPSRLQSLSRYPALPLLLDRLSPHAVVLADDAIEPDVEAMVERWQREVPGLAVELIGTEKGTFLIHYTRPPPSEPSAAGAAPAASGASCASH